MAGMRDLWPWRSQNAVGYCHWRGRWEAVVTSAEGMVVEGLGLLWVW